MFALNDVIGLTCLNRSAYYLTRRIDVAINTARESVRARPVNPGTVKYNQIYFNQDHFQFTQNALHFTFLPKHSLLSHIIV